MNRAAPALIAMLLSFATPAFAQEDGPADPVNEGMLELCPELKDAEGRAKEQLMMLFFEDVQPDRLTDAVRARVRELFDLGAPEDVAVLAGYLDSPALSRCLDGLRAVFISHGEPGLVWLLERYAAAPPPRRGRLIRIIRVFNQREVWRFLLRCLRDKTPVPDMASAVIAPPGYVDMRVCDHALRALGAKVAKRKEIELPGGRKAFSCYPTLPVEARNTRISKVGKFLSKSEALKTVLVSSPSLFDVSDSTLKARVEAIAKPLGLR